ncbi:alkaline shock response membrane anchor protein AmaP [Fodinicola acaciae]|uniref:alkaline shock response membrane anchor protein AmaP n=1 Tax=Fodinicola acaciae TaxID=2681555 RepID=UPI0013D1005B|nr:alkaline shock response membrane anchor protein AmaP [Fodinicola acaciae]
MNRRVDRVNRIVLGLLGLALLGGGGFGLFLGFRRSDVLATGLPRGVWLWPSVAGVAVVLALLGLWWALAQLRTDRVSRLELAVDPAAGSTTLLSRALLDAVGNEIADYPGVWRATARLAGRPSRPLLVVRVTVEPGADLGAVRHRVEAEAIAHARAALETDIPVRLEFAMAGGAPTRTLA